MIKLSIIILNFNTGNFLKECLQSIDQNQQKTSNDLKIELIVVDNNSKDKSIALAKKVRIKSKNITTKFIDHDKNIGFAAGNNLGIKKISQYSDYVLFLNPDTVVYPNVFSQTINFLENHAQAGAATCKLELANGQLDESCHRGFPTPWRAFTHFSGLEKLAPYNKLFGGYLLGHKLKDKQPHQIDACSGAFLMIKKNLGQELKWWDENFFCYGEDLDLCYRIHLAGYQLWFLPHTKITHYKGISSGIKKHSQEMTKAKKETKLKAAYASTEAMRVFYDKHYQNKYPKIINLLVILCINLLEKIRKLKIKIGSSF